MKPRTRNLLVAFVVVAIALLLMGRGRGPLQPAGEDGTAVSSGRSDGGADTTKAGREAGAFQRGTRSDSVAHPLPGSLRGTEIAGGFLVDENGNFLPTSDALALFDYFFSASGEESAEDIVARIRAEIDKRLSPPADQQAAAFLDRYLLYRERGIALGSGGQPDDADLRAGFEKLKALRREIFGEETAAALFGEEEAAAEVSLRQREIAADPSLTDEEKAARIEALYGELPEPLRQAHEQTMAAVNLRRDEAALRAAGGDDAAIRALRVERFGEEAADRLEALDREDAAWNSRLQSFNTERDRIRGDASMSAAAKEAAIAQLLQRSFDERERIRVGAIDEAGQQ